MKGGEASCPGDALVEGRAAGPVDNGEVAGRGIMDPNDAMANENGDFATSRPDGSPGILDASR